MLEKLSALVEGGIPAETVVLFNGSPGTGKSTLGLQLLTEHLAAGGAGIVVTTEASPKQIMQRAAIVGNPLREYVAGAGAHALRFIDCYSWRTGKPSEEPNTTSVSSLNDLSEISIKLTDALNAAPTGMPMLVLFDTPSTLTLHAPGASILKFMEVAFAKIKNLHASLVVPIEKDMHDDHFTAAMSAMADGVVTFKLAEENDDLVRYLRVMSMRTAPVVSSKWTKMTLSKQGAGLVTATA